MQLCYDTLSFHIGIAATSLQQVLKVVNMHQDKAAIRHSVDVSPRAFEVIEIDVLGS